MAGGGLLFVSQKMLDSWAEQGKIDFVGNVMKLLEGEGRGRSYALEPAVRFLKVVAGAADPHGLLHKVKQVSHLKELGAEQLEDSVLVGDVAYEVEPGFLAEVSALQAAAAARKNPQVRAELAPQRPAARPPLALSLGSEVQVPRPPPGAATPRPARPTPLPRELEEKRKEAEALARFLLDNLS